VTISVGVGNSFRESCVVADSRLSLTGGRSNAFCINTLNSPGGHTATVPLEDARRATRLHQLWQMDFIVEKKLHGAMQKYSFLQIRDMASTTSILKYTLPAGHWEVSKSICSIA
jgi:hypothetical protein